jgi:hypothetical protein
LAGRSCIERKVYGEIRGEILTPIKIVPNGEKKQERVSLDEDSQHIAPENMQATIRGFDPEKKQFPEAVRPGQSSGYGVDPG